MCDSESSQVLGVHNTQEPNVESSLTDLLKEYESIRGDFTLEFETQKKIKELEITLGKSFRNWSKFWNWIKFRYFCFKYEW